MGEEEDRTFKSNFSEEGLGMLKERINDKLKEFMGDYTDDTLVEYVIVLLRNGRKKDDTAKELHVFLGDDNVPFISWLWDHLSSDLHLYLEPEQVPILQKDPQDEKDKDGIAKTGRKRQKIVWEEERERKKIVWDERERGEERERGRERRKFPMRSVVSSVLSSVHERENNNNNNNNRMVRERENSFNNNRINNDNHNRLRNDRTRYQQNDPESMKRPFSQVVAAPRRLLQFAVRDAITPRSASRSEPVNNTNKPFLRSVLASDSFKEPEDQEEVQEYQENQEEENQEKEQEYRKYQKRQEFDQENQEDEREEDEEEEVDEEEEEITYDKRGSRGGVVRVPAGSGRLEGRLDGSGLRKREERIEKKREGKSEGSSSGSVFDRLGRARGESGREENVEQEEEEGYDDHVAEEDNGAEKKSVQPTNKPSKILNISVNVNTWKPAGTNVETTQSHHFSLQNTNQTNKVLAAGNVQRETPKAVVTTPVVGGFKAAQSLEDPETRTLFVSNVHFGATKDALSRHFNKFGAVLKVIILLDTTTGQPTGSAFVEFLQKESAEAALSLNGTSFMSRILKVVRRNSSDSSQLPGYPIRRPAMTGRARGGMAPPPIRRMQWTRGTTNSTSMGQQTVQQSPGVGQGRNLVYTRVTEKTE